MSRLVGFNRSVASEGVIHVRFAGISRDIALAALGVNGLADDGRIKRAVAEFVEVPADEFDDCVVDRHANGNLTIRPQAVFG